MVSTRLIFLVTVLTISDAIAHECGGGSVKFCDIIRDAHASNEDGLKLMEGAPEGNGTTALKSADRLVVTVLKAKEPELIAALKKALEAELNAYVQVEADCSINEKCGEVLFEIGYAGLGLIMAIAEVLPDTPTKTEVENIISDLIPYMFEANVSVYRDKLQASGKQVLVLI